MSSTQDAARIRANLNHPIVDADCHWNESMPVLLDYLRDLAGPRVQDEYRAWCTADHEWYEATWAERRERRLRRRSWWFNPGNTLDFATSLMPALMCERLDELGIDFAVVNPSLNATVPRIPDSDTRRAVCRAYNRMAADIYAPFRKRFAPAALIPTYTPTEAIEELDYVVGELGMKVAIFRGAFTRPVKAFARKGESTAGVPIYVETLGLDNDHDYDPLWRRCVERGIAVTAHQGSYDWVDRMSISNHVFNRLGNVANANHAFTRALFLGGVTRRFPTLTFAFLEGGVGYGVSLLGDLISHWSKRNGQAMLKNFRPTNLDVEMLRKLMGQYGYPALKSKGEEVIDALQLREKTERERECMDDFEHIQVSSERELVELYCRSFYFGCEADDPMTAWAFDGRMPGRLKAIFGSDISHWDVPDMAKVVVEAREHVEKGRLTEEDFRDFMFANAVSLYGQVNPRFFEGTVVESAAREELQRAR